MKAWPVLAITILQSFLLLAHWFMFRTWVDFNQPMGPPALIALRAAFAILSVVFVAASLLSFRFSNLPVRIFYSGAALWMGFANFLFIAAWIAWLVDLILRLAITQSTRIEARPYIAEVLLLAAMAMTIFGVVNARMLRVRRIAVELPKLPPCWRGRTALLISDMHLGHVNGVRFARRVAAKARALNPAIVFWAGDLFDGSKVDAQQVIAPLQQVNPPLGMFFVGGNHEEFGGAAHFEAAVRTSGIRVLHDECVVVDGLHIIGIAHKSTSNPVHMRALLEELQLKNKEAGILLNHVPNRLPIAEHAGVSLQLSGHTHGGGQMFPFNLITRRAFGRFTYGLQRFGEMQVYTSSGVGTWGPPVRVGTHSEIVLLTFENASPDLDRRDLELRH